MARNIGAGETFGLWAPDPPSFLAPALGDQVERVAAVIEREMCDADGPVKSIDIARAVIAALEENKDY